MISNPLPSYLARGSRRFRAQLSSRGSGHFRILFLCFVFFFSRVITYIAVVISSPVLCCNLFRVKICTFSQLITRGGRSRRLRTRSFTFNRRLSLLRITVDRNRGNRVDRGVHDPPHLGVLLGLRVELFPMLKALQDFGVVS